MFSIWTLFVWVLFHCYSPACSALGGDNNKIQSAGGWNGFSPQRGQAYSLWQAGPYCASLLCLTWHGQQGGNLWGSPRKLKRDFISPICQGAPGDPPGGAEVSCCGKRLCCFALACCSHRTEIENSFAASFTSVFSIVNGTVSLNQPASDKYI